ncbi:hypothetical protein Tco_0842142 [Tanacetum coccineum]|uniref:Uncharacterized protein n=1 Tax=Tanacetum coccineum TaxID=301880 RepID=A0ABQ5AYF5_9ASTR
MDDPNITMEEYIRLEEEKARKRGEVFNWETARYGKIWYDKDVHNLRSVETKFPAIVFNHNLTSNETLFCEPTVVGYTEEIVHDFEQRLETIFGRQVNRVHILDFEGLTPDMRQDLAERMRMVYIEEDGQEVFVSRAWRRFFRIRAPLVQEFMLEFFSTCRIRDEMGLDVAEDVFGAYWLGSERVILDKGVLVITRLRFLLAGGMHLKRHAEGRKSGARLSGGHFIGRLAHHFGLASDDGLRGLSVVACELPLIDMGELVAAAGAPEAAQDAPAVDEGAQADPAPV